MIFEDREKLILKRDGTWLADGTEITHVPTRELFSRSLIKRSDGYFLEIGKEYKKIEVEDTAYFVKSIKGNHATGFDLILSDGSTETLDPRSLNYRPSRLVCSIKNQTEEARFLHAPYFEILSELKEDQTGYYLEIQGHRVSL